MFQPRYIQHSHLLIRHAEKLIRYRRDRLSKEVIAELRTQIERVRAAKRATRAPPMRNRRSSTPS
jgi:hypothetical protein